MKNTVIKILLLFLTLSYSFTEKKDIELYENLVFSSDDLIVISGAGTSIVNGTYFKAGTLSGYNYYTKGNIYICKVSGTHWRIASVLCSSNSSQLYYTTANAGGSITPAGQNFTALNLGANPVPSVSIQSAPLFVNTNDTSSILGTSALFEGNVTSDNGNVIIERGIVYSKDNSHPEVGGANVLQYIHGSNSTGVFNSTINSLEYQTIYSYRAYAKNSGGINYGIVKTFTTLSIAKILSIVRQNPVTEETTATTVSFRATFDDAVKNVDITDFTPTQGSINSVTPISTSVYDVEITGISTAGTIGLSIKGVAGVAGINNILTLYGDGIETLSVDQSATNDYLNQAKIGQTFTATTNGSLSKFTIYPKAGNHTFSGTADLKIYSGDESAGGATLLFTESINISNSTAASGQVFTLDAPQSVTLGNTYSIVLDNFSGTGVYALEANTAITYTGGHVIFTGQTGAHNDFDLKIKIYEAESPFSDGPALATTAPTTNETYTKVTTPVVTTTIVSNFTAAAADLAGNVIDDVGFSVTERGILYSSTDTNPKIGDAGVTKDMNGAGIGVFSKNITGFTANTIYYYRAYAINSEGTSYGTVKMFTTLNIANITSFTRQTPVLEETTASTVIFRATFDGPVKNVDATDFTLNSTAGGNINSVTAISTSMYDVETTGLSSAGTIGLSIKGVDGITGTNNILTLYGDGGVETLSVDQSTSNDYLNQAKIGQTFTATTNGTLSKFTVYPKTSNHTFSGTADLKIYSGDESAGGATLLFTESINISNSTAAIGQTFVLGTPQSVTLGNTYSIVINNFAGSGAHALKSNTAISYTGGHVIFTGYAGGAQANYDLKIKIHETGTPFSDGPALATTAPTTNETYTKVTTPVVTTTVVSNVTATSADLAGNVTEDAGFAVTERGILYSTTDTNPKIGDANITKDTNGTGTGIFSKNITGFTANAIYYYRAYATNSEGTGYGAVKSFSLNNALYFLNGDGSIVTIADNAAFDFSGGFTAEAWIRPDGLNTRNVFSQYGTGSQEAFAVFLLASGKLEFSVILDGSTDLFFETTSTITANTWVHVAFTFDGTTMKAYINGVAAGTKAVAGTMFNSTAPIEIGARDNAHFFDGVIDEVRFWTRALTESQINAQKDGILPAGTTNGLVAYYKMNQGIAGGNNAAITTLTDSGPNGLDGTLNNFIRNGPTSNFVTGVTGTFTNGIVSNVFTTTGNWSNPANWSLGVVPTQIEGIIIEAGKTITIDVDDLVVDDFELQAGATLSIPKGKEITVQNSFVSNGTLDLGSDSVDSGVLLIEGTSTGTVTYNRGGLLANKWSIVTPPVSGQTVKTFAENGVNDIRINPTPNPDRYAIGYYDDAQAVGNKWAYFDADVNASTEFIAGQSYAISRNTNGAVAFVGTLQTDNLNKTLVADQWSAIGNPYTTYFPANKNGSSSFLNDNFAALDNAFKSLYLWDVAQNKYIAVTEVDATNRSLPPGQGFFVRMKTGQTSVTFNQAKRSTKPNSGTTTFGRTTTTTPSIELSVTNNTTTVTTDIKYFDTATQGLDPGYDIGNFNSASFDVFSHLLQDSTGTNFTIQSLPVNNYENMIIPIGIKASNGTEITFTATAANLPTGIKVVLEDRTNNTFTELSNNGNYTITLTSDSNGIGQFYLRTSASVLGIDTVNLEGITLYTSDAHTLKIIGLEEGKSTITLYDLLGKKVQQTSFTNGGIKHVSIAKIASGMYIVHLQTEKGQMTKKINIQ